MVNKNRFILLLLVALTVFLSACGAPVSGKIPASLSTIEAQAEDIIDFAPSGNWQRIKGDVDAIAEAWKIYQPQALKDGATQTMLDSFKTALTDLRNAVTAEDRTGAMQASNDISAVTVDLFALYHPTIPADVGRLDVLERQVVLDTAAGNFTAVNMDLEKINKVWETLKPSVLAHKGEETAAQFDESLATLTEALKAQNSAALTGEAQNALELVDEIEQLF